MMATRGPFLVDVALNLTDCVFRGVDWKGRRVRPDDFSDVMDRAVQANVQRMIISGTCLAQCHKAIALCLSDPSRRLRCTVGVHPAHCAEMSRAIDAAAVQRDAQDAASIQLPLAPSATDKSDAHNAAERLSALAGLMEQHRDVVVAVGEIGLDYAELRYCPREVQQEHFVQQLRAFRALGLPFLFHSRDCGMDFVDLLEAEWRTWPSGIPFIGVVHSFNGPREEQERLLAMEGVYFSVNGSAFREASTAAQIAQIPLTRIMFETDAPWCGIRDGHYGAQFVRTRFATSGKGAPLTQGTCVEGRVEPCHLRQVVEAYAGALRALGEEKGDAAMCGITEEEIIRQVYENCLRVFPNL